MSANLDRSSSLRSENPTAGNMRLDIQQIFDAAPGCFLVLAPDSPRFTTLAVTDAYLRATKTRRSEILGRGVFEVFPDNPDDPATKAVDAARASLQRVVERRCADVIGVRKYDIRRPESEGGGFEERFWDAVNVPVLGVDGQVVCIINRIEDVTGSVRLEQKAAEQQTANIALRESRRAAINLVRDAVAARQRAEQVTAELRREVAERKRAEEALRESERRERERAAELAILFEAMPTPVLIAHDPDCLHITGNRAADELLQNPPGAEASLSAPAEVRPRHFRAFKDGRELRCEELPAQRAARGEPVRDFEFSLVFENGTVREVLGYGTPLRDEAGRPRGAVHVLVDITETKRAESALRESEQRLRLVLRASATGTFEVDLRTGEGRWNATEFALLGLKPGDAPPGPDTFFRFVHPEDVGQVRAEWEEALRTGTFDAEFRIVRPGGEVRWLAGRGQFIFEDPAEGEALEGSGQAVGFLGVNFDITARKQAEAALRASEERFRVVQELSLDAFTILTAVRNERGDIVDFRWEYANPEAGRILRHPPEELAGRRLLELFPGNRAQSDLFASYVRVVETGQPHDYELRYESEGIEGWFRNMAVKLGDGLAIYFTDITQRKQAEEAIKASLREKEVLLREIHHRVKNNLQVISSLVSLQADALPDAAFRGLFQDVRDRVRSMAMVHEKLYQSEGLAQVAFAEYTRSLLTYLWRAHRTIAGSIQLSLDLQPVTLSMDAAVPCGLLLNELATNALKHAFRGRSAGEVTVALHQGADGRVRLGVRDDGVGLPAGLDWPQSRSLGLQLVQMLARQLNATVEIKSGPGTEFVVEFLHSTPTGNASARD